MFRQIARTFVTVIVITSCLAAPRIASAQQLLTNGDLETFSFGSPDNWSYGGGQPGSGQSAVTSPFTGIYPAGSSSLLSLDGPSIDLSPSMGQNFAPQAGQIDFAADFRMGSLSASPTYLVMSGNHPIAGLSTAFIFTIDGSGNDLSVDGFSGAVTLLTLTTDLWYHIEGTADIVTHTLSGSVTPFGSAPVTFPSMPFNGSLIDLRRISVEDSFTSGTGGTFQNGDIYLDNFSVTPEPGSAMLLLTGAALFIGRARASKRAPR